MVREHARKLADQAAQMQTATRDQVQRESQQAVRESREQIQRDSQQAVQESLDRLRQETAKVPEEFEQNVRATLTKIEEEFEQKSVGAQHETYEALSKAADWYQKKAHTTMQSSLEKAVEQSTSVAARPRRGDFQPGGLRARPLPPLLRRAQPGGNRGGRKRNRVARAH